VKNEEVLQRVEEERNILRTLKRRMGKWIDHIIRRNCRLKRVLQGKIEMMRDEEEDVSSYWMALRKGEGTGS
jgi:hypothetical protein